MKKGFTLIELLAVIIILAVIALITTPIVLNVVENVKEKSRISSVNSLIDATRLYMSEALLDDSIDLSGNLLDVINTRVKGTKPSEGEIKINGSDIGIAVKIDGICYSKYYTSDEIRKTNDSDCFIALEASDYVMTALDVVINYEECVSNLNDVLETSYTEEELDKICKNELEVEGEITLKGIILAYYVYDNQKYISLFEETNIAELDYVEEKGYERCFEYTGSVSNFDINYDVCMEEFEDEDICSGGKADLLGDGNLITLKEYILSLDEETFEYLIDIGFIENIKYDGGITITNYLCHSSSGLVFNKTGLPMVSDVVIPTTINGLKVVEIADVYLDNIDNINEVNSSFAWRGLTSVDFTNARYLEKIGKMAFEQNLISDEYGIEGEIDLSNATNLKEIGEMAFTGNKITSLKLPNKIISIGKSAFNGNFLPYEEAFFYKVIDNDGVLEIDDSVLVSYGGYGDVVFPSNIKEIATSFTISDVPFSRFGEVVDLSQTRITDLKGSFRQIHLKTLKLPNTLETISSDAFDCSYLDLIEIDNTKDAISGSPWGAGSVEIKWLRDS